jgi:N-methylhydantoinase A/oxoprolinase/acetone carboxylase beta subunit
VRGPALIGEYSGTAAVPPGWRAAVDRFGALALERG